MSTFTLQDLNLPATVEDVLNNIAIPRIPEPPKMGEVLPKPTLESVLQSIAEQFSLLSTVIKEGAQGNSLSVEDQSKSLQDCVALTLQQAEWFKEMVEQAVDKRDFDELVSEAVSDRVCTEVEHYFDYTFSPDDHFDFGDAVASEVADRIDDAVRDRLDDAVQEQLEELVAEKLKNVRVVFD